MRDESRVPTTMECAMSPFSMFLTTPAGRAVEEATLAGAPLGSLPSTGAEVTWIVVAAVLVVAAGVGAYLLSRRGRRNRED
ncbi:LPXTG cell wall anchor domain-containing protein [Georgenia sp. MJ206]|uniref:LPXTG cell wall anchor domain-containing protein n=1 Tax=Georgenia wangjunii TaxID=3117730 RepID=UPI002F26908A